MLFVIFNLWYTYKERIILSIDSKIINILNRKILSLKWPVLAIFILLINYLFSLYPTLVEQLYFNRIFQIWRVLYDYTLGFLPFPIFYILVALAIYLLYKFIRILRNTKVKRDFGKVAMSIVNFLSIVIILFYGLWGFNYTRKKLSAQLDFSNSKMTSHQLLAEANTIDSLLYGIRLEAIGDSTIEITNDIIPNEIERKIRISQEKILKDWGFPTLGRVRVRKLQPQGILLRFSTAGVYVPFVGEGHIDAGLHPIQIPFTMAHEMGHGYGFTDEGECNFIAFVTCMNSNDKVIQYSALLTYYRYILNNLRRSDKDQYIKIMQSMDYAIKLDINAINTQMAKFPDLIPEIRDIVYDTYLKSHGVKEGLSSYSTIIRLIHHWKESGKNIELIKRIYPSLSHGGN